jgi:hypothetical protein
MLGPWKVVEPRPEPTSASRSNAGNKVVLGYDLLEFKKFTDGVPWGHGADAADGCEGRVECRAANLTTSGSTGTL